MDQVEEQAGKASFAGGIVGAPRARRWPRRRRAVALPPPVQWEDPPTDAEASHRSRRLAHRYRRLLGVADVAACTSALVVCIPLLGRGDDSVPIGLLGGFPLVLLISKLLGLYDRDELVLRKSTLDEAPTLFQLATLFSLLLWIGERPLGLGELGGDQVLGLWVTLFVSLLGARILARTIARQTTEPERCLLLGDYDACERARTSIARSPKVNARVVAEIASARIGEEEVPMSLLSEVIADNDIDRVIIAPRSTDHGDVLNLVRAVKSMGLNVSVLPRLLEIVGSSVVVDDVNGLRVLGVRRFGLTRSSRLVKRGFDIAASGLGLVVLAPAMVFIALLVRLDSRGPAIFLQPRVGRDGHAFRMVKFRTMVDGAEELKDDLRELNEAGGLFKIDGDPRITRLGNYLRRSSIDELPQLFNVLRGDMSLVGPRPLIGEDDSQIEGWDRHRLHLQPGMTGPWQVLGAARIPLDEMVKLDYLYVATWSLWGDVKILLRTFGFVLRREGL